MVVGVPVIVSRKRGRSLRNARGTEALEAALRPRSALMQRVIRIANDGASCPA